MEILPVFV